MKKTAIVIGATGLIGNELLKLLLNDDDFQKVNVFVRRPLQISHEKLTEYVVDFNGIEDHLTEIKGDVLFCCIGTTIRKAGSKEAFFKVDAGYPLAFAKAAKQNGLRQFILISSLGANKESSNFYLKVKGEVESALKSIGFESLLIFRPSMLLGKRKEFRLGESVGKVFMKIFSFAFQGNLRKYLAIDAKSVAVSMVIASKKMHSGFHVLESDEISSLNN